MIIKTKIDNLLDQHYLRGFSTGHLHDISLPAFTYAHFGIQRGGKDW